MSFPDYTSDEDIPEMFKLVRTQNGFLMDRSRRVIVKALEWNSWKEKTREWFLRGVHASDFKREVWVYDDLSLVDHEEKSIVIPDGCGVYEFFSVHDHEIYSSGGEADGEENSDDSQCSVLNFS